MEIERLMMRGRGVSTCLVLMPHDDSFRVHLPVFNTRSRDQDMYSMPWPDRDDFTADDILHDSQTMSRIDDEDQDGTLRIPLLDDALH